MRQLVVGNRENSFNAEGFFITDHPLGARPTGSGVANAPLFRIAGEEGIRIVVNHSDNFTAGTVRISRRLANALRDAPQNLNTVPSGFSFHITRSVSSVTTYYDYLVHDEFISENRNQVVQYMPLQRLSFSGIIATGTNANIMEIDDYVIMMSAYDFETLAINMIVPATGVIVGGYSTSSIMRFLSELPTGTVASFADSESIAIFMNGFGTTRIAMLVTAIVIGLFAVVLMYSFISVGLSVKRRNISILRSMGARTWDVVTVFLLEAVILAVFILVGALVLALGGMWIGNMVVQGQTGNSLRLFTSGFLFWAVVLGVAFAVIVASYLLPVWGFARARKNKGVLAGMKGKGE